MALIAGAQIGPYEIVEPLGAGGMGEVYRARDPRLGRDVAIKVLRQDIGDRRRFELEARAASALNHPNILTIHDIGEENGAPYIVAELLDGENLRAALQHGALPVRRLLDIAVLVAAGLAAAHARGIVHRDLKPENVMVLRDGQVKILDFGLAKAADSPDSAEEEDTITARGALVGTVAYMSPEQVQDRALDGRSDQFSFGTILYEMAAGTHPFRSSDRIGTMAAIAKGEPAPFPPESVNLPPLRWVIDRCLAKDPDQRYASSADLYAQLKDIRDHISDVFRSDERLAAPATPARRRLRKWMAAAAVLLLIAAFAGGAALMNRAASSRTYQYLPFATEAADESNPAWSPDGGSIAYTAQVAGVEQVFVRRLDRPMPAQLTQAAARCAWPFWAGDGARIYYWSANALWAVSAAGGEPRKILGDISLAYPPASISPDGATIAYFHRDGPMFELRLMRTENNSASVYDGSPFPRRFRVPGGIRFSPDGRKLLVWLVPQIDRGAELWVVPFRSGSPQRVSSNLLHGYRALHASWMPDNRHIVLASETIPGSGSHTYLLDTATGEARRITAGTAEEREPAVSPDGDRMAFSTGNLDSDLLAVAIDGRRIAPLLATSRREYAADWSPDGRQYVYVSDASGRAEIWLRSFDEAWARPVVEHAGDEGGLHHSTPRFSPDGKKLAYMRLGADHRIWITSLTGGQAVPLEQESRDQHAPAWSTDGRWIAYTRYRDDGWEIAKAPSAGDGSPMRLTKGGAASTQIDWSRSGEELCYLDSQNLMRVSASGGDPVLLAKDVATFMYRPDGRAVYALRRDRGVGWEMVTVDAASGVEIGVTQLALDAGTFIGSARLHPDGHHFVLSVTNPRRDIWILSGLSATGWSDLWRAWRSSDAH